MLEDDAEQPLLPHSLPEDWNDESKLDDLTSAAASATCDTGGQPPVHRAGDCRETCSSTVFLCGVTPQSGEHGEHCEPSGFSCQPLGAVFQVVRDVVSWSQREQGWCRGGTLWGS
eukprot:g15220.t1